MFYSVQSFSGGLSSGLCSPTTIITFDDLSERLLDGVSLKGVTFGFVGTGNPSPDIPVALFGTTFADYGESVLMNSPWAAGPSSGELTLNFNSPITSLSFDAGLTTTLPLTNGFSVALFQGNGLAVSIDVPTFPESPGPLAFSEASFAWASSGQQITSAIITFDSGTTPNFVFDNLSFTLIPEPTTFTFLGLGSLAFVVMKRRK